MAENQEMQTTPQGEILPADVEGMTNLISNTKQLAILARLADRYANSTMVPANYQKQPDNCFVALELSSRMNVSPVLVMQNLYVVQGKPAWSGQACKALVDGCGKFTPLKYVFVGEQGNPQFGCYATATRLSDGEAIKGTTITMQMAQDEGWLSKNGSKWKTMPEQMLKYRAAAFFARTECPNVLMGFQTADEVIDVQGEETPKTKTVISLEDDENAQ